MAELERIEGEVFRVLADLREGLDSDDALAQLACLDLALEIQAIRFELERRRTRQQQATITNKGGGS